MNRNRSRSSWTMKDKTKCAESPAALVAIIRAANLAGDRDLERAARRELKDRFSIELKIGAEVKAKGGRDAR